MKNILNKIFKTKKAFTLIEVVASLGVLTIGILSIMALVTLSMQSSKKSGYATSATLLLQRIAEDEKRKGLDNTAIGWTAVEFNNLAFDYRVEVITPAGTFVRKRASIRYFLGANTLGAPKYSVWAVDLFIFQ